MRAHIRKHILLFTITFTLISFGSKSAALNIAVLSNQADEASNDSQIGMAVSAMFVDDFTMLDFKDEVARADVQLVTGTFNLLANDEVQASAVIKLANEMSTDFLLVVTVDVAGDEVAIKANLLNGETGQVALDLEVKVRVARLLGITQPITQKIAAELGASFPGDRLESDFTETQSEQYLKATKALAERKFLAAIRELRSLGGDLPRSHPYFQSLRESVTAASMCAELGNRENRDIALLGNQAVPWLAPIIVEATDRRQVIAAMDILRDIGTIASYRAILPATQNDDIDIRTTAYRYLAQTPLASSAMSVAIEDPSAQARSFAVSAIRYMPKEEAFKYLPTFANDPEWRVRTGVASAASTFEGVESHDLLKKLMQDDHRGVKAAAIRFATSEELIDPLLVLLSDEDVDVSSAAAYTLSRLGNAKGRQRMVELMDSDQQEVAKIAIRHIIDEDFDKRTKLRAIERGLEDGGVSFSIASALEQGYQIPAEPLAKAFINEPSMSTELERYGTTALMQSRDRDARKFLWKMANGEIELPENKDRYRYAAITAMAREGSRSDGSKIAALIQRSRQPDPKLLAAVAEAGNPDFVRLFKAYLRHEDADIQRQAGIGCAMAAPDDTELLLSLLELEERWASMHALDILEYQRPPRALATVKNLLKDESKWHLLILFGRIATEKDVASLDPFLTMRGNEAASENAWLVAAALGYKKFLPELNVLIAEWENNPRSLGVWFVCHEILTQGPERITSLAKDRRPYVRSAVMRLAQVMPNRDEPGLLCDGLLDHNARVSDSANRVLFMHPSDQELDILAQWLDSDDSLKRNWAFCILADQPKYRSEVLEKTLSRIKTQEGQQLASLIRRQQARQPLSERNADGRFFPNRVEELLSR